MKNTTEANIELSTLATQIANELKVCNVVTNLGRYNPHTLNKGIVEDMASNGWLPSSLVTVRPATADDKKELQIFPASFFADKKSVKILDVTLKVEELQELEREVIKLIDLSKVNISVDGNGRVSSLTLANIVRLTIGQSQIEMETKELEEGQDATAVAIRANLANSNVNTVSKLEQYRLVEGHAESNELLSEQELQKEWGMTRPIAIALHGLAKASGNFPEIKRMADNNEFLDNEKYSITRINTPVAYGLRDADTTNKAIKALELNKPNNVAKVMAKGDVEKLIKTKVTCTYLQDLLDAFLTNNKAKFKRAVGDIATACPTAEELEAETK